MSQPIAVSTMHLSVALTPLCLPPLPSADDEAVLGCGWFDSSFELRHGLEVTELSTFDAWSF